MDMIESVDIEVPPTIQVQQAAMGIDRLATCHAGCNCVFLCTKFASSRELIGIAIVFGSFTSWLHRFLNSKIYVN